jgi:hypothetical protein
MLRYAIEVRKEAKSSDPAQSAEETGEHLEMQL